MAHQLHIAYSDLFSGVAIVSGGPYNCADNSLLTAMKRCMMNTDEPLPVAEIAAEIRAAAAAGKLADTANLSDDRVWLFHGTEDTKISAQVHAAAAALYARIHPGRSDSSRWTTSRPATSFPPRAGATAAPKWCRPSWAIATTTQRASCCSYLYPGLTAPESEAETELLEVTLPGAG